MVAEDWDGDPEALRGLERQLSGDAALCDQTFASKHEAFTAGLLFGAYLCSTQATADDAKATESEVTRSRSVETRFRPYQGLGFDAITQRDKSVTEPAR